MRLKIHGCVVGLSCLLLSPLWAAGPVTPPDLTGVWTRPDSQGASWPKNLLPMLAGLERTAAAKAKMADYLRLVPPNPTGFQDSPTAFCTALPMPTMTMLYGHYPMEIIQRPEQVTMSYETHGSVRRIFLKDKLDAKDLINSSVGYSTGEWQGDTLVVETTALSDTFYEDDIFPHSENAKVIERYQLGKDAKGNKLLTIDMTLIDPESYPKPVQIRTYMEWVPKGRILPYECDLWDIHLEELRAKAAGH